MTARTFDGKKIPSLCDTYCAACGRKTYVWASGLCDGCLYRSDPIMRAWVGRALIAAEAAEDRKVATVNG